MDEGSMGSSRPIPAGDPPARDACGEGSDCLVEAQLEMYRALDHLLEQNDRLASRCGLLEEQGDLRDALYHMIIHDLRTPLTSIFGFLRILQIRALPQLSPVLAECLSRSLASTTELIEMVSSLLDVNKMEARQMQLEPVECDLGSIAADTLAQLEVLREGQDLVLVQPPIPVRVKADKDLLRRVFYNLLSNALKFAPIRKGRVAVEVTRVEGRARVTVDDDGPGIPPEYHETIFEKFGQVRLRSHSRQYSTGLGLTFCKLAIEAHGGSIGVESEPPRGSRFWFELPLDE